MNNNNDLKINKYFINILIYILLIIIFKNIKNGAENEGPSNCEIFI